MAMVMAGVRVEVKGRVRVNRSGEPKRNDAAEFK